MQPQKSTEPQRRRRPAPRPRTFFVGDLVTYIGEVGSLHGLMAHVTKREVIPVGTTGMGGHAKYTIRLINAPHRIAMVVKSNELLLEKAAE